MPTAVPIEDKVFTMLQAYSKPGHAIASIIRILCHIYNASETNGVSPDEFANRVRDSILQKLRQGER